MSFGTRVKEQRERFGLSRKDLADLIGVTASAIANYENNISSPKAELLYPLMDALKCDPNYLFRDEMDARGGSPTKLLYEEMEHIKKYRSLDPHGKEAVDSILDVEYRRIEQAKEKATTEAAAEMPSAPPVAAGQEPATPPNDLDSMTTEQLEALYEEQQYKKSASGSA